MTENKNTLSNTPSNHVIALEWGSVPADWHRHQNGGGWVFHTARVAETAYIGPDAVVYGSAQISDYAWVDVP